MNKTFVSLLCTTVILGISCIIDSRFSKEFDYVSARDRSIVDSVHFAEFDIDCHFVPITKGNIDSSYDISSLLHKNEKEFLSIFDIGKKIRSPLDTKEIRLKILLKSGEVIYVDEFGVVESHGESYQLDTEALTKLKLFLYLHIPHVQLPGLSE